jgi:hypothetical protein
MCIKAKHFRRACGRTECTSKTSWMETLGMETAVSCSANSSANF